MPPAGDEYDVAAVSQSNLNPIGTRCGYDLLWVGTVGCYSNAVPSTDCSSGWEVPDDCKRATHYGVANFWGGGNLPLYCGCAGKCICKKSGVSRTDWYCGEHPYRAECPSYFG